jgi:cytochrome c553
MKNFIWVLLLASMLFLTIGVGSAQQEAANKEQQSNWAFPTPSKVQPPAEDNGAPRHVPGSTKAYTMAQIEDLSNPPDWFPNEHPPAPRVVAHGGGKDVLACGSCHLMSGLGHPESANLAGLPAAYIETQMEDFKSGARIDKARMNGIARAISDDDIRAASDYFASLKPKPWVKVIETATVPQTYVGRTRMRFPLPGGGTEPIGDRIIEVPQNPELADDRDPNSGFIAYAPVGSIKKGEFLVTAGGGGVTVGCANCHGENLTGGSFGEPPIAGRSPSYLARQLYGFKRFTRNGPGAQLMQPVVENLSDQDILDIAAYLASLNP